MQIDVLTLFPGMFKGVIEESIIKRAREKNLVSIRIINLRDFTHNKHKTVDDYPYGGGRGMVLKPEPIFEAVEYLKNNSKINPFIILLSPQGELFTHEKAIKFSKNEYLIIICGHYEGIDERVKYLINEEISIGNYVLTGGEIPAMVLIDAVIRLIPGVLKEETVKEDSFYENLLEYPHFTRPKEYKGYKVPDVLLSGNHKKIKEWRRLQSLKNTLSKRPNLLSKVNLKTEDVKLLKEIKGGKNGFD